MTSELFSNSQALEKPITLSVKSTLRLPVFQICNKNY